MLNRKVKKLIRDPKLFFSDMVKKQKKKINSIQPKEFNGNYQYTVVSAVYNVGRYLDEYFSSITKQRLDFKKHIHLILVDDGSTDNSAEIIKRWERKYPDNITYIHKENGGQSSARNLGLEYVKTEWVTFIDPDDFIDYEYFYHLDAFSKTHEKKHLEFISANFIFYFEESKTFKDSHPLRYRFANGDKILPLIAMDKHVQLSVNSAIFRLESIKENNIKFDCRIKPNYEDAHFVTNFITSVKSGNCAFVKSPKYYYRKRGDGTSTLDNSWQHPGLYSSVLEHGCLAVLEKYNDNISEIPKTVKMTVLYHLMWTIKTIINNPQKISFLTKNEQTHFVRLLEKIFYYIDEKTILEFSLAGCWFYHKVGILNCFKKLEPSYQIVYIESYDAVKNLIELRYFSKENELEKINSDGVDIFPYFAKTMSHDFLDKEFIKERRIWVPLTHNTTFNIKISDLPTRLTLAGKQYKEGIKTDIIIKNSLEQKPKYDVSSEFQDAWLFMDRDVQADDNAEHLYEYVQKNHPEKNIFFALTSDSHDWERLKLKNFNLVAFGSDTHESILKSCSKVISSHVDKYVTNYLGPKMLSGRHFIFLQHGVIHNDLSDWLNQKENIDVLVTTSPMEYEAICGDNTHYKFTDKNVKLTGLPRHDKLYANNTSKDKAILIMPTWRANIVGKPKANSNSRELSSEFMNTTFAQSWFNVLHSEKLKSLAEEFGFKVIFFPHANINPYIDQFNVPDYIEVYDHTSLSIQELFIKSSLMITDYSSVAFDMAVINKQTIYYQFDKEDFFSGGHHFKKGYFEHDRDGFGPVVNDEKSLFSTLHELLKNNANPERLIQERINLTFPLRDGQNCKRTYNAICELDSPLPIDYHNIKVIEDYAERASTKRSWILAKSRWEKLLSLDSNFSDTYIKLKLAEALRELGEIDNANMLLESLTIPNEHNLVKEYNFEKAQVYMACHQWFLAAEILKNTIPDTEAHSLLYIKCLSEMGEHLENSNHINLETKNHSDNYSLIFDAYQFMSHKNWMEAIATLEPSLGYFTKTELKTFKPELMLAKCHRENGNLQEASRFLKLHASHSGHDLELNQETAILSFSRNEWGHVVSQFKKLNISFCLLAPQLNFIYLKSLRMSGKSSEALLLLQGMPTDNFNNIDFMIEKGENHLVLKEWNFAAEVWFNLKDSYEEASFKLAASYRMLGLLEEALSLLVTDSTRTPKNIDEWVLRGELAQLTGDWNEASYCWSSILRYYPENVSQVYWDRLYHAQLMSSINKLTAVTN
ncbi:CDP-glycerol glycerophosphotransferase family protein [Rahnella bonaserana]|jgi:glycosyltransferase involved in cell wall biosynthesis/CDP-glycerol glycerophosphotransferase (TagB/SpsB family)